MTKWFYEHKGNPIGPVEETVMQTWFKQGSLHPTQLIRREFETEWKPAAAYEEITGRPPYIPPPPSLPANVGLFSFLGRTRRRMFWAIIPLLFAINISLMCLDFATEGLMLFIHIPLMVPLVWLALATYVKRWHDLGQSGWMILTLFIPFANFVILLLLGVLPGNKGPNKYGEDPNQPRFRSH